MTRGFQQTVRDRRRAKQAHTRGLALCFMASIAFLVILALVSLAFGQPGADHPFPFKTLEDITTGTPAWVLDGPPNVRYCSGSTATLAKYEFTSGAGSIWVVYTDGRLFTAAYFPPGVVSPPISIVIGHIVAGTQVVVESNVPFDPDKHRPCNPWIQKSS